MSPVRRALLLVALVILFVLLSNILPGWLWHPLPACDHMRYAANCRGSGFWGGIGGDIGEITLIGGAAAVYSKHNCGSPGCWRIGKHPTADGLHQLCRKHHPDLPDDRRLTLAEIHERHFAAKS